MDAAHCRELLAKLLDEEATLLVKLEELLTREHGTLLARDVAALEQTAGERQSCIGALVRIEEERRSLCRMLGRADDLAGLEQLMRWCDPQGSLRERWAQCAAGATRCRELNDRNGALVAATLKRVEGLLEVLTGQNRAPVTYGPRGAGAGPRIGRVLATEV